MENTQNEEEENLPTPKILGEFLCKRGYRYEGMKPLNGRKPRMSHLHITYDEEECETSWMDDK